jgi:hypothetical protein
MVGYTYPRTDLDRADQLLSTVGSYWATTYQGMDFISDILKAKSDLTAQTWVNFMEMIASISRFTVPIFHHENWYPIVIKESELNNFSALVSDYETDTAYAYDQSGSLEYGKPVALEGYFSVAIPSDLKAVKNVLNGIANPSIVWSDGVDYWMPKPGVLTFKENPFTNDLFPVKDIFVGDAVTDRECVLWVYSGQWDYDTIYTQFGYALELRLSSNDGYLKIVNAILDAFTGGTKARDLQYAWSAITGVPIALEESETVELVTEDARATVIITDKNVYRFALGSTVIVAVDDKVYAGDALVDTFQIYEFTRGAVPSSLTGLVMGPSFLSMGFFGDLTFENSTVAIVVEENVDGYTKVSWPLGGFVEDVTKFWNDVHTKGVQEGKTLAMYMDVRPTPEGQPAAMNLPTTINPLEFLCENFLRYNTFLVKINTRHLGKNKLPTIPASSLRKMIPPQTSMIVLVELVQKDDPVIMDGPGSALSPGYEEVLSGMPCMTISENISGSTYITESTRTTLISGRCQ